jgi:hypothetical protein
MLSKVSFRMKGTVMKPGLVLVLFAIAFWHRPYLVAQPQEDPNEYRAELLRDYKAVAARTKVKEIKKRLGKPLYISREILYMRTIEQWVFDSPRRFLVETEGPTGKEARILSVHLLREN